MKRRPSVHIYYDSLKTVLKDPKILEAVITQAQEDSINRTAVLANKRTYDAIIKTHSPKVETFNLLLATYLNGKGFKHARTVLKTDRQYKTLCQVSKDAEEFCKTFMLPFVQGMQLYIKLGVTQAGKNYMLSKFLYYKEAIFTKYSNQQIVKQDENPELTAEVVNQYISQLNRASDAKFIIKEFMHDFVWTSLQLISFNTTPYAWVRAQVLGLKSLEVIPEPYQLHGEGASKRYLKYKPAEEDGWREKLIQKKKNQISS